MLLGKTNTGTSVYPYVQEFGTFTHVTFTQGTQ